MTFVLVLRYLLGDHVDMSVNILDLLHACHQILLGSFHNGADVVGKLQVFLQILNDLYHALR